jgi:multiple sugar transport system substrate-binding protein
MYESLYEAVLPRFERETGYRINELGRLPHPALNTELAKRFAAVDPGIDFLSTHTKYAPSQVQGLLPLDDHYVDGVDGLLPAIRSLATMREGLMQVPRFLDLQLLYVRTSAFADPVANDRYTSMFGGALAVPRTWSELINVSSAVATQARHGFVFPGRESGLFGTFYEMLVASGGDLFAPDLTPIFSSPAGWWVAGALAEMHTRRRCTPAELPAMHYDEVSACFRKGQAAMVADWPGSDHLYRTVETCFQSEDVELALLPMGLAGRRAAYAGCHSFAVARNARNQEGALLLLKYLTNHESRMFEAQKGAVPVTKRSFAQVRAESNDDPRACHRWQLLSDQIDNALIIPPRFANYPACESILWRALQRVMLGEVSARVGLDQAAADMQPIVKGQVAL